MGGLRPCCLPATSGLWLYPQLHILRGLPSCLATCLPDHTCTHARMHTHTHVPVYPSSSTQRGFTSGEVRLAFEVRGALVRLELLGTLYTFCRQAGAWGGVLGEGGVAA